MGIIIGSTTAYKDIEATAIDAIGKIHNTNNIDINVKVTVQKLKGYNSNAQKLKHRTEIKHVFF